MIVDDLRGDLLQKVVDFLSSFLQEDADPLWSSEYFKWKLQRNPAGRGFLSCAVSGDEVVGTASITLKRVWYNGKIVVAGETGDTYTHPAYRKRTLAKPHSKRQSDNNSSDYFKKSIFGRLVRENTRRALDQGIGIIYGTPNEKSRPGYENRLNYKAHPMFELQLCRPTSMKLEYFSKSGLIRVTLPYLLEMERLIESAFFKLGQKKRKKDLIEINEVNELKPEIDELWERLRHQQKFSLVRDQTYFHHRFIDNPIATYCIYTAKSRGKLKGIIVSRIHSAGNGVKTCTIADWLFDKRDHSLFDLALGHVIHDHYRKGIHEFRAWLGERAAFASVFQKHGFFSWHRLPIIFYQSEQGKELLNSCPSLDFTIASSDNI